MSFKPSKCEVVRVTERRNPVEATYQIHSHDLTITKTGKYLGVIILEDLSWKAHMDATTKKANNSLRWDLSSCPQDVKARAIGCCQTHPRLGRVSMGSTYHIMHTCIQLETVQRHAARFVTGDYRTTSSTSQMIQDLG